ncbi:TetR family transcriptional regulator [Streptomyces tsukubensis]|uniref:TetR family transcriptional regulator n=1 Tax=Streptomyces tsukubensis TaxID=83656 RepID=A0A1V4A5N4_9ACTN|nr:TetR family transcriptional regulator [Streptomyces tsukubensis]QFR97808.1 TetR family transcriptional regulator [Streptomyces tsukubensis]
MAEGMGLRERKKMQTRSRLLSVALRMFSERGFDKVSVAEIAAAADVSKMTVFNYFGSKEELICGPLEDHVGDVARTVRERRVGESASAAVHRAYLAALVAHDPSVGASDNPVALSVRRLMQETPSLLHRVYGLQYRALAELAEVLTEETGDPIGSRLAAGLLFEVRTTLIGENHRRAQGGASMEELVREGRETAERAFAMVEQGLGDYATRSG